MTPLEIALQQLGKKEDPIGSNWGHPVQDYLASVGINFPASWCMAFVYWCVQQSHITGNPNPLIKTGGVLHQWYSIPSRYKVTQPSVGDIFIQDHGKGLGHCGMVQYVSGNIMDTVEGNTNDTGAREGYEVCQRQRKVDSCAGFIHIPIESA